MRLSLNLKPRHIELAHQRRRIDKCVVIGGRERHRIRGVLERRHQLPAGGKLKFQRTRRVSMSDRFEEKLDTREESKISRDLCLVQPENGSAIVIFDADLA